MVRLLTLTSNAYIAIITEFLVTTAKIAAANSEFKVLEEAGVAEGTIILEAVQGALDKLGLGAKDIVKIGTTEYTVDQVIASLLSSLEAVGTAIG